MIHHSRGSRSGTRGPIHGRLFLADSLLRTLVFILVFVLVHLAPFGCCTFCARSLLLRLQSGLALLLIFVFFLLVVVVVRLASFRCRTLCGSSLLLHLQRGLRILFVLVLGRFLRFRLSRLPRVVIRRKGIGSCFLLRFEFRLAGRGSCSRWPGSGCLFSNFLCFCGRFGGQFLEVLFFELLFRMLAFRRRLELRNLVPRLP